MTKIFELALRYNEAVLALGAVYQDQDRNEVPELWIQHDAAYLRLYEAYKIVEELDKVRRATGITYSKLQGALDVGLGR